MHDDGHYPFESPFNSPDWSTTHTLIVNDNDAGIGVEDVKGQIWLRLNPAFVLSWRDRLEIKVVPQKVKRANRTQRRTKRAAR